MTDQERRLQKAEVIEDYQRTADYLNELRVKAQRIAEVLAAVAEILETEPSRLESFVRSSNENIASGLPGISAGDLDRAVNAEQLQNLCREIGIAERKLAKLAEQKRMLRL